MKPAFDKKHLRDAPRAVNWLARAWLARAFSGALPVIRLAPGTLAAAAEAKPSRVIVLIDGPNPTFDYYLAPRLENETRNETGNETSMGVEIIDMRSMTPQTIDPAGAFVILCRYLPRIWEHWLKSHAPGLAGIGLLLDDDMARLVTDLSVPRMYRLRLASRGLAPWRFLSGRLHVLWTSGDALAGRFAQARPRVLQPVPSAIDLASPAERMGGPVRIAFHATAAHFREHKFAAQLCAHLQGQRDDFVFDVIASKDTAHLWQGLRAHVRAPMPWPQYRQLAGSNSFEILLAPLAPVAVNHTRSPTKAIDAVRFGAAAILSDGPAYERLRGAALLVPFELQAWRDAITTLLEDRTLIQQHADTLRAEVSSWRLCPAPLFPVQAQLSDAAT